MRMTVNFLRVLAGKYSSLGSLKVSRLNEYALMFPECAGRFVFIGDDGQADFEAASEMLLLFPPQLPGLHTEGLQRADERPLVAFVAVKAVQLGEGYAVPLWKRSVCTMKMRSLYPPVPAEASGIAMSEENPNAERHRFFYFTDYGDLAKQLTEAGWLKASQCRSIVRAIERDSNHDPLQRASACDLQGLRAALASMNPEIDECDEVEKESFGLALKRQADIRQVHICIYPPPRGVRAVVIQILAMAVGGIRWPAEGMALPSVALQDASEEQGSRSKAKSSKRAKQFPCDPKGYLRLPWPCEALSQDCARAVIIISTREGGCCRCFVILDQSHGALRDKGIGDVSFVPANDPCNASAKHGEMTYRISHEL